MFQSSRLSSVLPKKYPTARGQGLSGDNEDILKQLYRRETALANDLLGLSGGNEDILERVGNQVTELRRAIDGLGTQLRSFNETIELLPGNRSE